MADHLRLDFDLVEFLAGVDTNDGADHFGNDNHVTEVRLDEVGLLVGLGLLLGLTELLDETHGLALQATVESAASTGMDNITEFLGGKIEKSVVSRKEIRSTSRLLLVALHILSNIEFIQMNHVLLEFHTAVRELAELSLLLQLCIFFTSASCPCQLSTCACVR